MSGDAESNVSNTTFTLGFISNANAKYQNHMDLASAEVATDVENRITEIWNKVMADNKILQQKITNGRAIQEEHATQLTQLQEKKGKLEAEKGKLEAEKCQLSAAIKNVMEQQTTNNAALKNVTALVKDMNKKVNE